MNILFDVSARKAISNAVNEARNKKHDGYDTDDLLLGIALIDGPVAQLLAHHGLTPLAIRSQSESYHNFDEPPQVHGGMPPTSYVNDILELAQEQSMEVAGGTPISNSHLLQCTIHIMNGHPDSTAAKICNDLGVDLDELFDSLTALIENQYNAAKSADRQVKRQEIRHLTGFNFVPVENFTAAVLEIVNDDQLSQLLALIKK